MASEDKLNEEARFLNKSAPRNMAYDLLPHDPRAIPAGLDGIENNKGLGEVTNPNDAILLKAVRRQGNFLTMPFTVAVGTVIKLRPQEARTYFLLQNIGGAGNLLLGLGAEPTAINSLLLTAGSSYEPFQVPTNEVYVTATVATVTGILWYASEGNL